MSRRRTREIENDIPLPWQVEAILWCMGLVASPLAMLWFAWEITEPGRNLAEILGTSFDPHPLVQQFWPYILLFGMIWGVKVRCWCRRWIMEKIGRTLSF